MPTLYVRPAVAVPDAIVPENRPNRVRLNVDGEIRIDAEAEAKLKIEAGIEMTRVRAGHGACA